MDASGRERLLIGPTTGLVTCPDFDVRRGFAVCCFWRFVWGFVLAGCELLDDFSSMFFVFLLGGRLWGCGRLGVVSLCLFLHVRSSSLFAIFFWVS